MRVAARNAAYCNANVLNDFGVSELENDIANLPNCLYANVFERFRLLRWLEIQKSLVYMHFLFRDGQTDGRTDTEHIAEK